MSMTLETLVYDNYKNLNENDKYIWSYILNNKKDCESMSIQQLASKCNVSHTTILRFAQKLGLNGYSELKFYLKMENKKTHKFEKCEILNLSDEIKKTIDTLIKTDFLPLCKVLDESEKIYAFGSGELQNNAIKELKRNFLPIGKLVNVIEGDEEMDIITNLMTENDMIFFMSLSGENKRVNYFAQKLKEKGTRIVSITQSGNNTLSK